MANPKDKNHSSHFKIYILRQRKYLQVFDLSYVVIFHYNFHEHYLGIQTLFDHNIVF